MKCVCASLIPGMIVRLPASITRVFSFFRYASSDSAPTAMILSPLIAIASALGRRGLSVATRPLTISVSAGPAGPPARAPPPGAGKTPPARPPPRGTPRAPPAQLPLLPAVFDDGGPGPHHPHSGGNLLR